MEFEVRIERLERGDLIALNILAARAFKKWRTRILRAVMLAAGAFFLLTDVLILATTPGVPEGMGSYVAVLGVWGALLLALGLGYHRFNAAVSRRLIPKTSGASVVTFGEDSFTDADENLGSRTVPYTALFRIYRFRARYFLFLDKRFCFVLPEARFTRGDPARFAAFLEERSGKRVEFVK